MTKSFVIFLIGLSLGFVAHVQIAEQEKHEAAMHEAQRPVCFPMLARSK